MHAVQVGSFCFRLITCIVFQLHGLLLKERRLKTNHAKCEKNYNKKSCENKNYNCISEKNCSKVGNT